MDLWGWLFGNRKSDVSTTDIPQINVLSSRQALGPEATGSPSLYSLAFDTTGLQLEREETNFAAWSTPEGDGVLQYFFAKPPDIARDLQSIQELRAFYIASMKGSPAQLVELTKSTVAGCVAIRMIIKSPQTPSGMTYVGSITIPFRDFSYVLKVQCAETGMTGIREAVLFEQQVQAGKVTINGTGIRGEWNADDAEYDAQFPQHPLSRLRRMLNRLGNSCSMAETVRQQSTFPLP